MGSYYGNCREFTYTLEVRPSGLSRGPLAERLRAVVGMVAISGATVMVIHDRSWRISADTQEMLDNATDQALVVLDMTPEELQRWPLEM